MSANRLGLINPLPVLLEGLIKVFERTGRFEIIGQGKDSADALQMLRTKTPNILIADLNTREFFCDVLPAAEALGTKVVNFTACEEVDRVRLSLNHGASAYVLMHSHVSEIVAAVDSALCGEVYVSPSLAGSLFGRLRPRSNEAEARTATLSFREEQIIKMLLLGKKNRDIASTLHLTEKTVKCYMTTLMQKLHAKNRLEVVLLAQQRSQIETTQNLALRSLEKKDFEARH